MPYASVSACMVCLLPLHAEVRNALGRPHAGVCNLVDVVWRGFALPPKASACMFSSVFIVKYGIAGAAV